ncbi:NADAR family protein [Pseudomonas sp. Marseille-P9899]|uniref:NADAR family protein n=1 Tax=Pseudomonas sp. Marseille-P9899 TaxID=2730401 RepID=UPI00158E1AA5|nr:NADAR family protein [Pseudomonas sp. Marseille-P9899]
MQILFYETDKPYGCFSNFSRHPITLDDILWPTTEHYFQACKFTEQVDIDAVREAKTPFLAAQIGRERHRSFRSDWDQARDPVMLEALRAKFTQHADLRETLLGTGDAELVEHTKNDRYWADGGDGTGKNMLGKLLEQVRAELNQTH